MNINRENYVEKASDPASTTAISPVLWIQASIITLGAFSTMLSSTMFSAALPAMAKSLGVSDISMQWVATTYFMALAAGVPVSAWAVKRFGATRLWLCTLMLFAIFSVACALAVNFEMLLGARVLQGLAGGLLVPAGQTILGLTVGRERLGRIIGTIGVAIVIAPLLGTSLGAVLIQSCGWRGLFWINVPICVGAYLAGYKLLPHPKITNVKPLPFDWLSLAFVFGSLPMLMEGMKGMSLHTGKNDRELIIFILGVLFTCLFIWRSLRTASPLLHLRLFKNRGFTLSALLMVLGGAVSFGGQFLLPLYFRDVCHESLAEVGLLLTPQLIGSVAGFPLAGYFSDKLGARVVLIAGGLLTVVATLPLTIIDVSSGYAFIAGALAARGFGLALATVPAMAAGLAVAGNRHVADAAPLLNILQRIGAMVGTALVTAVYVRNSEGSGSVFAFQHGAWILTAGALGLLLAAFFMPDGAVSTAQRK
ncbi:drug resistance MFS transporter, drug:H+ antiporter-2 family protein [Enterobacter cloacae S611]|uniref:Drug resistance MFS transporter, drug:H+ antiporter-2 family protein n=1 Tax=Enterobacter cloacae S611 TaxID=1399146 RepID=A0ABP2ZL26_ENTCL|nr:drug resistance MFS transporter, drug:H+ antiporter-2 family protein [Enterobacter cloacae S611]